ncbi:MAG: putative peptidoglycan glycosyltransferase FtsW [Lentisphaeria bacterium]|nr:putative peptidoglycan glycosyltransferase FtsW [Lentisphaeria bacterium]
MSRIARTILLACAVALLLFGVSMLYSTTYSNFSEWYLKRQLVWIAVGGIGAGLICWKFNDSVLRKYVVWLLAGVGLALFYLAVVNLLHGHAATRELAGKFPFVGGLSVGSARWIRFKAISLQPSELAKPVIILYLSAYFPRNARHAKKVWRGFLKPMLVVGVLTGLILLGGDLSSTVITGGIVGVAAFIGGMRLRYIVLILAGGCLLALAAVKISPERVSRVTSFKNPEDCQQDEGYQLWYSQLALGSGGVKGMGFTRSRIKHQYLPEAHTDFIVAIIGEELGFLGVAGLIALYLGLGGSAFWLAMLAHDREGMILCGSIAAVFTLQSFVNISVVSGFGPTTGVTAPFLSYGGSSMIVSLVMVGLLLASSARGEREAVAELEEKQQRQRHRQPRHHGSQERAALTAAKSQ